MKFFMGMHVRVVRLDDKLSHKKSDFERNWSCREFELEIAALIGQFVVI